MPVQANTLDTVAGCREVEAAWALVVRRDDNHGSAAEP
jgi:hypothetical protein